MVAIKVLPPAVVNRIAAGEVIERPASLVKELVENAIDAGSKRVYVLLEEGGRKRVRVRDDGCGIAREDLPLAFQSHATSKLRFDAEPDADQPWEFVGVATLGFRGEALASIASVADVEILSRTASAECGFRYEPGGAGGGALAPEPASVPEGTTIEVRNLFGRTPARRKFLKTVSTELSHVTEQVLRIALAFPGIAIRLDHGERTVLDFPAVADRGERVASVLGADKASDLLPVDHFLPAPGSNVPVGNVPSGTDPTSDKPTGPGRMAEIRLTGFVGKPRLFRGDQKGQHCFVNGRWIRDRVISRALRDAYQGFQIPGRHPIAYLYLDVPDDQVDINVHPQKSEVRFFSTQTIHRLVNRGVRRALEVGAKESLASENSGFEDPRAENLQESGATPRQSDATDAQIDRFSKPPLAGTAPRSTWESDRGTESSTPSTSSRPAAGRSAGPEPSHRSEHGVSGRAFAEPPLHGGNLPATAPSASTTAARATTAFQVLREFIVVEKEGALVVLDQHALHEKVLYERILARLNEGKMIAQRLMLPEIVRLEADEVPLVPRIVARLEVFGFEIEPFGERELAVHAVPVLLDRGPASQVVQAVASWVRTHEDENIKTDDAGGVDAAQSDVVDQQIREIAQLMACKQAVKAGMKLEPREIESLLEESDHATDPRFCPHGRPTSVTLRRAEIEKWFDRK
jgi:DNA mismatch repair protein MutL